MTPLEITLRLVIGLALVLVNGFFVAIEFALTRVRQYPESDFDTPALQLAWNMTQELEIYLTSCQVGITASSIALGIVAEPALAALFEPIFVNSALASVSAGAILAFLIINLVHLTHGEQTPTYLGVERSKMVCRYGARPLYWFAKSISPIMRVGDTVAKATLRLFGIEMTGEWLDANEEVIETRAELHKEVGTLLSESDISEDRREEVLNALSVDEKPVESVMVGIGKVDYLSTETSLEQNFEVISTSPHTRFPLVGASFEEFKGIVYAPSILNNMEALKDGSITFADVAASPLTITRETSVSETIDIFQDEQQEIALVKDEGNVVGLVTVTDALEAVMGDLQDPLDQQEPTNQRE